MTPAMAGESAGVALPFDARARPYMEDDLENTEHPYGLPDRNLINLDIDLNMHGVGGNDTWGARTIDSPTIDGNKLYSYGFILDVES